MDSFKQSAQRAVLTFAERYKDYFTRNNARVGSIKRMLDPLPRVALLPGLGLFGLGRSKKDAKIAADIAEAGRPLDMLHPVKVATWRIEQGADGMAAHEFGEFGADRDRAL